VPLLREPRIDGVIVEKSISFTTALLARSPDQKSSIRAATSIQLFWRDRVLGVEMHLPPTLASKPYRRNICVAGQCTGSLPSELTHRLPMPAMPVVLLAQARSAQRQQ